MKLTKVTLTGADSTTDIQQLAKLTRRFPFVEWGVLRSVSRAGMPRYPESWWVDKLIREIGYGPQLSGHLCGEYGRESLNGPFYYAINNHAEFWRWDRIQINQGGVLGFVERIGEMARRTAKTFILQVHDFRTDLSAYPLARIADRVNFLLDCSGGRGTPLSYFESPPESFPFYVGYAGGIGPRNVRDVLTKLTALPGDRPFWIDCESALRPTTNGNDYFDLDKCRWVLEEAENFVEKRA